MMRQSSRGGHVNGSAERRNEREFLTCLHNQLLAVVGSRRSIEVHITRAVSHTADISGSPVYRCNGAAVKYRDFFFFTDHFVTI